MILRDKENKELPYELSSAKGPKDKSRNYNSIAVVDGAVVVSSGLVLSRKRFHFFSH